MTPWPRCSACWTVTPLKPPRVATAMKQGVGTDPWGVVSVPARAAPSLACRENETGFMRTTESSSPERAEHDPRIEEPQDVLRHPALLGHGPGADLAHADAVAPAQAGDLVALYNSLVAGVHALE